MVSFSDIKDFLELHRCTKESESDGINIWRTSSGDYITFFSDSFSSSSFVLKRILEKLGKNMTDFELFLKVKYDGRNIKADETDHKVTGGAQLKVEIKKVPKGLNDN